MSKFAADIKKFADKANLTMEQAYRGITLKLFSAVILDTPVLDGQLRGSWYSKENTPRIDSTPRVDPSGSVAITELNSMVGKAKLGGKMTMANSMPYAYRVEYEGWSGKSPQGMVRINVARIQGILAQTVKEVRK